MAMRARLVLTMALGLAMPGVVLGQGLSLPGGQGVPGLGGGSGGAGGGGGLGGALGAIPGLSGQQETPQQKREFCQRVAGAAARCQMQSGLSVDMVGLTTCLVRSLPAQDSLRVAQVANSARGNAGALMSECGIGLGR